ncbi:MAG TPA: ABC transporter permease [Bacteroidota bacterium]|nr:ABC transporter permease [Bacteroidota bacterium]
MNLDWEKILRFTLRRVGMSMLLVASVITIVFFIAHLAPGDPLSSMFSPTISPSVAEVTRAQFGLDKPILVQYFVWVRNCLRGDFGNSISHGRPVGELIASFLPNTILLASVAIAVEFVIGIMLSLVAIRRQRKAAERIVSHASLLVCTIPTFWIGVMLVGVCSFVLGILPSSQMYSIGAEDFPLAVRLADLAKHIVLPALTIAIPGSAIITRYFTANLTKLQNEEYLLFARSYGISEKRLFCSYEFPNAAVPLITFFGLELGTLLTGALVTETIFSWPGMGRLTLMAIGSRDYPLVMGCTVVAGGVVIIGNLVADLLYILVDPRVRVEG